MRGKLRSPPGDAGQVPNLGYDSGMLEAMIKAFVSLLHPRMLLLMFWPVFVALGLWTLLAILFWTQAAQWVDAGIKSYELVQWMLAFWPFGLVAAHVAWVILVLAFIPLVLVTAVVIIGIFAMPMMVNHVAERNYPDLQRTRGGTAVGSVWNTVVALAVFFGMALATLPGWLVPLLWPVIPVLLFAYLNQRVFRYDALAEHASNEEIRILIERHRGEFFLLGIAMAIVGHVPVLGFFSPVYAGLVFIHYGLAALQRLRTEPLVGVARRVD